jgi:hypothetical protein
MGKKFEVKLWSNGGLPNRSKNPVFLGGLGSGLTQITTSMSMLIHLENA